MDVDELRDLPGDDVEALYTAIGGLLVRTMPDLVSITAEKALQVVEAAFISFLTSRPGSRPCDWIVTAAVEEGHRRKGPSGIPLVGPPDPLGPPEPTPLSRALASLSPREREAVRLALAERLSAEEIAAELGVSSRYAKALVQRAIAKLRKFTEEWT